MVVGSVVVWPGCTPNKLAIHSQAVNLYPGYPSILNYFYSSALTKPYFVLRKDIKEASGATVSSLDTSAVKQKCRLSLNLAREGLSDYRFGASASASGTIH